MPPGVYDKDGFRTDPNGGVFADPSANLTDPRDYESWDWKQIRAAVIGSAATSTPLTSTPFADPESIRNASVVFNRARMALEYVGDNVRLQTEALAGEHGAWKSPAADAFRAMTLLFSAKLEAKAQQINGGEFVGTNNVPAQLWNSGNYLQWAQETIRWIDSQYATYVASVGVTMGNGLARISDYPELVTQMGEDMKKVVRRLAEQYTWNTNSVTPPDPSDFNVDPKPPGTDGNGLPNLSNIPPPGGSGGSGGGGGTGGGGTGRGNIPPPNLGNIPPPPGGQGSGGSGGGSGDTNRIPPPSLNVPPPPGTGGGSGGTGGGAGELGGGRELPPPPSLNVPPPPGLGGGGGGGTGGGSSLPPPPSLNVPPPPGAGGGGAGLIPPPSLNIPAPPGMGGGGSGGSGTVPRPPSLNIPRPPGAIGGDGAGGGSGSGTGALRPPPSLAVNPPPSSDGGSGGSTNLPRPPSLNIEAPPGTGTGTDRGGAAVPPPMMPPPAGMGGGQPGGAGADRPDSSGLLGGVKKPWEAGSPPSLGDPSGTKPPAVKPEDWAAGTPSGSGGGSGAQLPPGAPMMPPPAGMGGGQPGGGNSERPDSSGLLGGEKKPWEGAKPPALDLSQAPPSLKPEDWATTPGGDSAGATVPPGIQVPAGGEPSTGGSTETPAPDDLVATPPGTQPGLQAPGAGMPPPMMPPGAGGQPGGANAERPDSSGLLGGLNAPWAGSGDAGRIGGTSDVMPSSATPESWAITPGSAPAPAPVAPQPVTPMMPPPVVPPGAGTPATGVDRPDSSALLGGHTGAWEPVLPPLETEQVSATAAAPSAPWAVTPGEQVVALPATPAEVVVAPEVVMPELVAPGIAEPVAESAPTPAAAPAGWAASSGVVPAVPDASSAAVAGAVLGVGAVTAAAAFGSLAPAVPGVPPAGATPPGAAPTGPSPSGVSPSGTGPGSTAPGSTPGSAQSHSSEFPNVNGDGDVEDDRDEDRAGAGLVLRGGAAGPMPGVDSVVVVRPDDAVEDTSAWDAGGMDFLLPGTLMPLVVPRSDRSGWDGDQQAPDLTLKSSEPWEPMIAHATYRRRKAGEDGPAVIDSFVAPPSCGDEYAIPEDEREAYLAAEAARAERAERQDDEEDDEDEDAEPQERSAADLLNESGSAWGGSQASRPTGVLE